MYTSCYTCRRRRIECEMSQPPCRKCKNSGLECFQKRPLRWVEGAAFRAKVKRTPTKDASVVSSAAANFGTTPTSGDALTRTANIPEQIVVGNVEHNGALNHVIPSIPLTLDDPSYSNLDRASRYYLYYYSKSVCKLFIMYDSNQNPLRNLIPAAMNRPTLFNSILALASRHMKNAGQSFCPPGAATFPHDNALLFKYKAIQGLSQALNDSISCQEDTTVASAFLLIFLDLLESGSDKWNYHVEGIKRLIAQIQPPSGPKTGSQQDLGKTIQGIRDFIMRQIYLIDTLGATFTHPRLLSDSTSLYQPTTTLQKSVEQSYLGCPEYLLDALRYFSLYRDIPANSNSVDEITLRPYIHHINTMLESTQEFDSYAWASSLLQQCPPSTEDISKLYLLAQSYKIASLIYGRCVLGALVGNITSQNDLVDELIGIIDALRNDEALFKCILWPMFVAGLESHSQTQRDFVTNCLEKFWFETKCLNVVNAGKILRKLWQQADQQKSSSSHWIFNIGQLGRDWLLI